MEGGRIDHAYHDNQPRRGLEETLAFDAAVAAVLQVNTFITITDECSLFKGGIGLYQICHKQII